jgi:hypothetical protein
MITFFEATNIFEYPDSISHDIIYPKASYTSLLPFQFYLPIGWKLNRIRVINKYSNEYIDISSTLIPAMLLHNTSLYTYFLYNGMGAITGLDCGQIWQLEIKLKKSIFTKTVYSSYFELINPSDFNYIKIYNSKDFENRIYSSGYYDVLYFDKILRLDEPYIEEIVIDNGDGSKFYESQIYAENYNIVLYGDKYFAKWMEKLHRFDTSLITFDEYTDEPIFDRIQCKKTYDEDTRLYQITLNFKLNNLEKLDCLDDYEFVTLGHNDDIQDTLTGSGGIEIIGSDGNAIAVTRY